MHDRKEREKKLRGVSWVQENSEIEDGGSCKNSHLPGLRNPRFSGLSG